MPRILVAECKQEVSSFNPLPSHYADFSVCYGEDLLYLHRGGHLEMAGALGVFAAREDVQVVPTYSARARTSAGTLAADGFARIAHEFLDGVRGAGRVDAVYFSLHGAMSAEGEDDPEGYLLAETRQILGEKIPIVISLDLHAILTDRMLQHVDALTAFHTYPHVDFGDTGERAATLLLRILDGQVRPMTARVFIPALVRGDELKTETGLLGRFIRQAQAIASRAPGLAAGMIIGNPFTDVPALGSSSFVITDDHPAFAERAALGMAEGFWEVRAKLQAPLTPIAEAVRIASQTEGGVIMTDAADAPSSGASGDSNAILRGLVDGGYRGRALVPIVDPPAVSAAFEAGVGATVRVSVGGALDTRRFRPLPIVARVRMLSDGAYRNEYMGTVTHAGNSAVLEADNTTLVVTSQTVSLTDRSLFLGHGQDPRAFDLVVVKSPHTRHEYFEAHAAINIGVDAPGATSANLHGLGHVKCGRPIFPLDDDVAFAPRARIFRRPR